MTSFCNENMIQFKKIRNLGLFNKAKQILGGIIKSMKCVPLKTFKNAITLHRSLGVTNRGNIVVLLRS